MSFGSLASKLHVRERRCAKEIRNEVKLLDGRLSLEEDPAAKKLPENATDAPHVNGGRVVLCAHQDFGCTVVLCHNLLGHVLALVWFFNPKNRDTDS